jgi:hypothetical protein
MAAVSSEKFVELLQALMSANNDQRQQAEKLYQQAKASEPDNLIIGLLSVAANASAGDDCRGQSLVLLRQLVTAGVGDSFAFGRMAPGNKASVATELLVRFEAESNPKLQHSIGEVISQLAEGVFDAADQRAWLNPSKNGWPELLQLVFRMADPQSNSAAKSCESSIRLLKSLVETIRDEVGAAQQQIGSILQNALSHSDVSVRCAAFLLVCEMVSTLDKQVWAPLTATAPVLLQLLQQLAEGQMNSDLDECLQAFVIVVETEPDFFKQQLEHALQPATFFATLVKAREADDGVRKMSLEWLVSLAEKKPKWLVKHVPGYAPLVIECCIRLMLEVDDSEEDLKCWLARMDDEEGEEDSDEMTKAGAEGLDRVVENIGMESIGAALFAAIGNCVKEDAWQAKFAALTSIRQTIEYVEDTQQVAEVAKMVLAHVDHPHPRVRYAAFHALGQIGEDQKPHFQETTYETIMPILFSKIDDPSDRVASMAMSAFVTYGSELEAPLMLGYSHDFMQRLVAKLQSTKHRMVQEESVTSIAVIAGVLEEDFSQYYDGIMPLLKQFVLHAREENQHRLRGKAFECISLLGAAVGKEKFLPDARDALEGMLTTTLEADDVQRDYMKEATERICKCLKRDFAPFLPHLLPAILKNLDFDGEVASGQDSNDDDESLNVSVGDGKLVKVHCSKLEEIGNTLEMLHAFCEEIGGAFFDYVPGVAEALLPLFSATDEMQLLDDLRGAAFQTWAVLIKCARNGANERGIETSLANQLVRTSLTCTCSQMEKEQDPEALGATALGLAECLKNMGPGVLSGAEVLQLVREIFKFIGESMQRVEKSSKSKREDDDEDQDENDEEEEELCRRNLSDVLGAVMEVAPAEFLQCMPECNVAITQWLTNKQHVPLALFLACDLVRHLKEQSLPLFPVFMPAAFQALVGQEADLRIPAAWLINVAAPLDAFKEAAPEAFRLLAQLVNTPAPKKKSKKGEQAQVAADNAVAALLTLVRYQAACCPPEVPAWQLVLSKLPLKKDEDEAKKVHENIVDLVLEQNSGLLGPDRANLGAILSCLAEVHRSEDLSSKQIDEKILKIFHHLPQEALVKMSSSFSSKQQKKIEKMMAMKSS